ncbi:DUF6933 domain-containing protein [Propionivibrio limicola]|uniref:DUF6933 domain-containing protein n=1 Tax=Propionivibrio limicola TaxID=167645 RepID=UPI0012923BA5|nr:hypothetical protein [Propionivibrio limicola]
MLIFNCSKAFAEFIEPKAPTGQVRLVGEPPSPRPSEDGPHLIDADGEPPRHVQQWLAHLIEVRGKPCVLAMDIDTRYAMVFTNVGKGNTASFLNTFAERLVNQMVFAAQSVGMMADFETMWAQFLEYHARFQFFLRYDRSTMTHLLDAARAFEDHVESTGQWPETHEECAVVDASINQLLRGVKGRRDHFVPATEMLCQWMATFGGLTPDGAAAIRERLRAGNHEAAATAMPLPTTGALNS